MTVSKTRLTIQEGQSKTYTVVLNTQPTGNVTVTINDPMDNTDVTTDPASLTFTTMDWNSLQTVTVSAAEDGNAADETATITHTVSGYGTATTADDVAVTVEDDAPGSLTVNFKETTYTATEGGTVDVTVTLDLDPERTITVPLNHMGEGGATSTDYSGVPQNVTFNSGDTEKSFTFAATTDNVDDDGESVKLTFGTLPAGVTAGTTDESVVSITDDNVPTVSVSFRASSYTVAEGNTVIVTVDLSADPERTVTILITQAPQGGATAADYSGVPASVVFNSGQTEKSFTFSATQDSEDDDNESVRLGFGTLPTAVSEGAANEAVISITDDDATPLPVNSVQASFAVYTYSVPEGSSVEVGIKLSADPERTVTILVNRTNQDGASSADYTGVPDSVTFNSGNTEKTFNFNATQDSVNDDGESVRLTFGDLPDGVTAGSPAETTVNITEDRTVSFDMSTYVATEGGPNAAVTVELNAPAPRQVNIMLTAVGQNGAIPADWSGVPEGLTFNAGDTSKTFTVIAVDDEVDDDGEIVELGFEALPSGFAPGIPATAVVTLINDDITPLEPVRNQCPADSGERMVLVGSDNILQAGESHFWRVELDPWRFYIIEVLGSDGSPDILGEANPGDLTLSDPHLYATWSGDGSES